VRTTGVLAPASIKGTSSVSEIRRQTLEASEAEAEGAVARARCAAPSPSSSTTLAQWPQTMRT
jgi:hypothetical protein